MSGGLALGVGSRVQVADHARMMVPRGYPPVGFVDHWEWNGRTCFPPENLRVIFSRPGHRDTHGWYKPNELVLRVSDADEEKHG